MVMTDPVADMFTRIRNAKDRGYEKVEIPLTKLKKKISDVLHKEGFISKIEIKLKDNFQFLVLHLKYDEDENSIIESINRVSKPGLRKYVKCEEIPLVKGGLGISIISTSSGIMSGRFARKEGLGGELLGVVW